MSFYMKHTCHLEEKIPEIISCSGKVVKVQNSQTFSDFLHNISKFIFHFF